MKRLIYSLCFLCACMWDAGAALTSCGSGYVLASHDKIDGVNAAECVKLWCYDLETGDVMGRGDTPANGYKMTTVTQKLYDVKGNSVECWGDRKWCGGEEVGIWNPEYGAYTKGGADSAAHISYRKGGCFGWKAGKPACGVGKSAIWDGTEFVCADRVDNASAMKESTVRRPGSAGRARNLIRTKR